MADEPRRVLLEWISRLASISSIVAVLVLSWMPADSRPSLGTSNLIEHFVAYFVTALVTTVAFVPPRTIRSVLAGMILLAGVAEIGQNFVPGRGPKVIDFLAGSAGAITIICASAVLRRPRVVARVSDQRIS
jgi:VanZ family protein